MNTTKNLWSAILLIACLVVPSVCLASQPSADFATTDRPCDNPYCGCENCDCVDCRCGLNAEGQPSAQPKLFVVAFPPRDLGPVDNVADDQAVDDIVDDEEVGGLLDSLDEPDDPPAPDKVDESKPAMKPEPKGFQVSKNKYGTDDFLRDLDNLFVADTTEDETPVQDTAMKSPWAGFDPVEERIDDIVKRLEKLEKTQLTEADVIRIVSENFTCLRVSSGNGKGAKSANLISDLPETNQTLPGFAGTFQVPQGGRVTSVRVFENGQWVDKPVSPTASRSIVYENTTIHSTQAGPYRVLATSYQQPAGTYRVSVYDEAKLAPVVTHVQTVAPPQVRRGIFGRMINPPVARRGGTCRMNADGTVTCN